jgi:serine protease Do
MKIWTTAALATALIGAAGIGAALAPSLAAQSRTQRPAREAMVYSLGGGSRLGVSISEVDAEDMKGRTAAGVMIDDVDTESPAAKAGFRKGDIVVEFDGERVRSVRQFTRLVSETPSGRTISAAVMRDGQRVSLNVTPREGSNFRFFEGDNWLSVTPPPPAVTVRPPTPPPTPLIPRPLEQYFRWSGGRLGITTDDLSTQLAEYFGAKDGVLVTSVEANSAAAKAGVKAGDVITSINGSTVDSTAELRRRLSSIDGGAEFSLGIMRDKRAMTLKGKFEAATERRRTTRTII